MHLAAYYYPATAAQKAKGQPGHVYLEVIDNGLRVSRITRHATDKRQARAIAAEAGATAWNF